MSKIVRETRETRIDIQVRVDDGGPGVTGTAEVTGAAEATSVRTGDGFLTHMIETMARYAGLVVRLEATGDLRHHLVEDAAIALGLALADEVPETAARYGWAQIPMDEALVEAAIDLGGRPYYVGELPSRLYEHFLQSLAFNLNATLHVRVLRGKDTHHVVEAAFKAVGMAIRSALRPGEAVFSTKGSVRLIREPLEEEEC